VRRPRSVCANGRVRSGVRARSLSATRVTLFADALIGRDLRECRAMNNDIADAQIIASDATPRAGIEVLSLVLIAIPTALILAAGWSHRWTTDDGFINVRVVQQIFDGHGPVFNAGERVEVATSTLWIALLVAAHAIFFWVPIEWVAAALGLLTTTGAVYLAQIAAARAFQAPAGMPLAVLADIRPPPPWDRNTSGVETAPPVVWFTSRPGLP